MLFDKLFPVNVGLENTTMRNLEPKRSLYRLAAYIQVQRVWVQHSKVLNLVHTIKLLVNYASDF